LQLTLSFSHHVGFNCVTLLLSHELVSRAKTMYGQCFPRYCQRLS